MLHLQCQRDKVGCRVQEHGGIQIPFQNCYKHLNKCNKDKVNKLFSKKKMHKQTREGEEEGEEEREQESESEAT